jgi:hypothetical protein
MKHNSGLNNIKTIHLHSDNSLTCLIWSNNLKIKYEHDKKHTQHYI